MYKDFYNLSLAPFADRGEIQHCWNGGHYRIILDKLKNDLVEKNGVFVLTGENGVGKTTLVDRLFETIDREVVAGYICLKKQEQIWFYDQILFGFGLDLEVAAKTHFYIHITGFLRECHSKGKNVLLVVDDADLLTQGLLNDLRQILNIEQDGKPLIKILLVGNAAIWALLDSEQNLAFRKKLVASFALPPLSLDETKEYIEACLENSGAGEKIFNENAYELIAKYSGGIIAVIDRLSETSLIFGCNKGQKLIGKDIVSKAGLLLKLPCIIDEKDIKERDVEKKTFAAEKSRKTDAPIVYSQSSKNWKKRDRQRILMLKSLFIICISVAFYLFLGFWQAYSQNNHEDIQVKRMKEETLEYLKNAGKR